uniref:Kazal-like domain-containing protein n=1 Tax=Chrysemys picta bellii TaxID=8478 RepID=A0A8C3PFL5_CHRPI
ALLGRAPKCYLYGLPGCPKNFNPVCGTDGHTYPNECALCLSNRTAILGQTKGPSSFSPF